jgi:putative DNA primase/helicase
MGRGRPAPGPLRTVHAEEGYPEELKVALLHRWLLSATAAALCESGFKAAGVLTFQGGQGIGKTSWGRALISDPILRDQVLKVDLHLDAGNKDSIMAAISNWIGEIGELDSSFRKDVARLKGFLTSDVDRIRVPYAKAAKDYPRRTVFYATVNDPYFLVDATGNRRWMCIPVERLDFEHSIDMQQLFAQLAVEFDRGEQWWLTADEERMLSEANLRHRAVSVIAEKLHDFIDLERIGEPGGVHMTAMKVLLAMDVKNPTNAQCKECGSELRQLLGRPTRVRGRDGWRFHRRKGETFTRIDLDEDDDIY